ncbi:MAG: hypothetical protein AB1894_13940 [Chloroflexota bacterium]
MNSDTKRLKEIAGYRLKMQRNYEPKLRALVDIRSKQLKLSDIERNRALKSIDALVWKLTASGIHLERLWENKESFAMQELTKNILAGKRDPKRFTDREAAFLTAEFEAFLFQARAFISVAQVHTLDACRVSFGGMLTNEKYEDAIKNAPHEAKERLERAKQYFSNEVFAPGKWGDFLKQLRDRVAHFDRIRPSLAILEDGSEELKVARFSLERLAQDFENGTYDLLVNVIAPIWERKWQAGPYQPGMWE